MNTATDKITDAYGIRNQMRMLQEECAELIQAINKYWRGVDDVKRGDTVNDMKERLNSVVEEMADVEVCLEEVSNFYNFKDKIKKIKHEKINRQLDRIANSLSDKNSNKEGEDK